MKKTYPYAAVAIVVLLAVAYMVTARTNKNDTQANTKHEDTSKVEAASTSTPTTDQPASDHSDHAADGHTHKTATTSAPTPKKVGVVTAVATNTTPDVPATAPAAPAAPSNPTTPTNPTEPTTPTPPIVTPPVVTPPTPAPLVNLVANPSVEESAAGVPTGYAGDGYGTNDRAFTYENEGHTGSHSLKATITTATGEGDAKWFFNPVTVAPGKTYKYSNWYKSSIDTQLNVMVNLADGTSAFYYLAAAPTSADWTQATGTFQMPANAVSATVFQALTGVGYVQNDDFSFAQYNPLPFERALVSLTFDDGWKSIYDNAFPLLNSYGFVSTQYLLTSTMDYPDYMSAEMMQALAAAGNEIAGHTVHHCDLTGHVTDDAAVCPNPITAGQVASELSDNKTELNTITGAVVTDFASPYGAYNADVVAAIKAAGYESHRSTDVGYNSADSFNPYNIKVQNMTSTTTVEQVKAWVDEAIANKLWLVIVYHEVTTDGTVAADATYSVTAANLNAQLAYIQQTGVAVVTVSQALAEVTPQVATTP